MIYWGGLKELCFGIKSCRVRHKTFKRLIKRCKEPVNGGYLWAIKIGFTFYLDIKKTNLKNRRVVMCLFSKLMKVSKLLGIK